MRKIIKVLMVFVFLFAGWRAGEAQAEIMIKVRALNPLETTETAIIDYPLPQEISQEDILGQKMTYSMEWPAPEDDEEGEPRKTYFQISFNDETGGYYIDDEVVLLPKEVVTLAVRVKDIWIVEDAQIEELRREAADIVQTWVGATQRARTGEPMEEDVAPSSEDEAGGIVLSLQEEILDGLDRIIERQKNNKIVKVGVERHIAAYEDSIADFRQAQQDLMMLENVIQLEEEEL